MSSTSSNHSTLLIKERMWNGWSWRDSSIGEVLPLQTTVSESEFKNHIKSQAWWHMPGLRKQTQEDSWDFLATKSTLLGELQAKKRRPCLKFKKRECHPSKGS